MSGCESRTVGAVRRFVVFERPQPAFTIPSYTSTGGQLSATGSRKYHEKNEPLLMVY